MKQMRILLREERVSLTWASGGISSPRRYAYRLRALLGEARWAVLILQGEVMAPHDSRLQDALLWAVEGEERRQK